MARRYQEGQRPEAAAPSPVEGPSPVAGLARPLQCGVSAGGQRACPCIIIHQFITHRILLDTAGLLPLTHAGASQDSEGLLAKLLRKARRAAGCVHASAKSAL